MVTGNGGHECLPLDRMKPRRVRKYHLLNKTTKIITSKSLALANPIKKNNNNTGKYIFYCYIYINLWIALAIKFQHQNNY